ncbi:hypothetical protein V6Z12_A03G092000 [Gossypium hirsutum]
MPPNSIILLKSIRKHNYNSFCTFKAIIFSLGFLELRERKLQSRNEEMGVEENFGQVAKSNQV